MTHSETIKKVSTLRPDVDLEDESLIVDKSKKMDKVVLQVESTPPIMRRSVAKKKQRFIGDESI